jgi:protein-L-isoaspartate O-methyltransferase
MQADTYRHKGLRRKLVDSLRKKGITDERVLAAMDAVPRHFFLDSAFADLAYEDKALPIEREQIKRFSIFVNKKVTDAHRHQSSAAQS